MFYEYYDTVSVGIPIKTLSSKMNTIVSTRWQMPHKSHTGSLPKFFSFLHPFSPYPVPQETELSWATTMGSLPLGFQWGLAVGSASETLCSRNEVKVFILVPFLPGPVSGLCPFTKGHNSCQDIYIKSFPYCCSHQSTALSLRVSSL